jgi:hypothetical protein
LTSTTGEAACRSSCAITKLASAEAAANKAIAIAISTSGNWMNLRAREGGEGATAAGACGSSDIG